MYIYMCVEDIYKYDYRQLDKWEITHNSITLEQFNEYFHTATFVIFLCVFIHDCHNTVLIILHPILYNVLKHFVLLCFSS